MLFLMILLTFTFWHVGQALNQPALFPSKWACLCCFMASGSCGANAVMLAIGIEII